MCVAMTLDGAFLETFGAPGEMPVVSLRDLRRYKTSVITAARPLRLVELKRERNRRLARAPQIDGIVYRPRLDPATRSVAIFARARSAIRSRTTRPLLDNKRRLAAILDRHGFALVD
jgi:hypothetical protein